MKPAWYIVRSAALWARLFNVLHWPYLALHLSFSVLGAALAPDLDLVLMGWIALAFFLGMGIAAHCYDLCQGDPLKLGFRRWQLHLAAVLSLAAAAGIGLWQIAIGNISPWFLIAIPLGVLFAAGYGLEWPGFHQEPWSFPLFWGAFPCLVGYFAQGIAWTWGLLPMVMFCYIISAMQREMSTRARFVRRRVRLIDGWYYLSWTEVHRVTPEWIINPLEKSLAWLSFSCPVLAAALLLWRL